MSFVHKCDCTLDMQTYSDNAVNVGVEAAYLETYQIAEIRRSGPTETWITLTRGLSDRGVTRYDLWRTKGWRITCWGRGAYHNIVTLSPGGVCNREHKLSL